MRARRILAGGLVAWSVAPFVVLLLGALSPDADLDALGLHRLWPAPGGGLRLGRIFDPDLAPLWRSACHTLGLAATVAALGATMAIVAGYLSTRLDRPWMRQAIEFGVLAAYGLPTVFLYMAVTPLFPRGVGLTPDIKVGLLHFLFVLPLAILLGQNYARATSRDLDRAAAMDGAGWGRRLIVSWREGLWRGWLAVFCISVVISWSDLLFSTLLFDRRSDKLIVDLFVLTYFDDTNVDAQYSAAALFSLVALLLPAVILSVLIAKTEDR